MKKTLCLIIPLCLLTFIITLGMTRPAYGYLIISLDATRTSDEFEAGGPRYLTSSAMYNATNTLLDAGFTISTTDRFFASDLTGASVLYTGTVYTAFSDQELMDVKAFVASGGGLVIQRDWDGFYPASDPLASIFGVTYNQGPYGISGTPTEVTKTADSPIWNGPAGSVNTYKQIYSSSVSGATTIGVHSTGETALATLDYGLGHIVFLTDMDAWDDFGDTDKPLINPGSNNAIVWKNIFHYACAPAAVPEPSTMLLLGFGLVGLCGMRRKFRK